jgi:hypothetical protein
MDLIYLVLLVSVGWRRVIYSLGVRDSLAVICVTVGNDRLHRNNGRSALVTIW